LQGVLDMEAKVSRPRPVRSSERHDDSAVWA
jgi:hypothetical protein